MAAMEQLEIHSKSYLVRWVNCAPGYTISWSIKPHKKSLNFGIFKHPGQDGQTSLQSHRPDPSQRPTSSRGPKPATEQTKYDGDCMEKMHAAGLLDVYWHGKCDAEKVTTGTYQVTGQGGMFALVFDNTFSKQLSKIVTVIIMTYPSNNPPPASHHLPHQDTAAASSASSVSASQQKTTTSPRAGASRMSVDSETLPREDPSSSSVKSSKQGSYTGILKKRKRKRHQGFARRYFSLDYTTATLSYYMNQNSSALRGAIPLSLAAISASEKDREICIDSGAEVWHLRADNPAQWEGWKNALERAAEQAQAHKQLPLAPGRKDTELSVATATAGSHQVAEDRGWVGVEALVGRVAGVRDAVRRLATTPQATLRTDGPSPSGVPSEGSTADNTPLSTPPLLSTVTTPTTSDRRPFWKRKASGTQPQPQVPIPPTQGLHPAQADRKSLTPTLGGIPQVTIGDRGHDQDLAANLKALLADLDSVVADFSTLLNENKHRRWLHRKSEFVSTPIATSRQSFETTASEEFFDADEGGEGRRVGVLNDDSDGAGSDGEGAQATAEASINEATDDDSGDSEDESVHESEVQEKIEAPPPVPEGPRDLSPLPFDGPVRRRATVLASTVTPPSLIGFLRKNVGKDLSTIAMPVSANEPTSLVQRLAEQLEYSEILDAAVSVPKANGERVLYIAAFAISGFSNARLKERAVRKPFNPMLGETFELVREDKGFRFLAEKVSHRPVIMACHADAKDWTFTQSPMPTQKFWGKSAELNTSGRVRIHFPTLGEQYTYTIATSFLRNIIAGEKYVEPVGTMTVHCETTGEKAIATFKVAGMFSGRSEEVSIAAYDPQGQPYAYTLQGKWTESLSLFTDNSSTFLKKVWTVGSLVDQPNVRYGFTTFAAQLNEITAMEKGKMAPTDSRLRPDQRMVEEGRIDEAEEAKRVLEEKQRLRRKEMEEAGEMWQPRWFVKVREYADEEVWRMKTKEEAGEGGGYWEQRKEGKWRNVPNVF